MDRKPWSGRHPKRALIAIVGILGIGVVALGGFWVALAPGPAPSQPPATSPSAVVAEASASASGSAFPSFASSTAVSTASATSGDSIEPTAWDSGLLSADPTTSGAPATPAVATPTPSIAPTATRTATPHPPTAMPPTPTPAPKPNLTYAFRPGTPNPVCGTAFTLTAIVTNSGQAGSVATNYIVFDEYPEGTMLTNGAAPVPALAPGDSITLPVSLTASTACGETHTLRLRVDALAWVDETDEADNYLLIHYDIRAPNVYPTSLSVPGHPACGSVTVSVHVSNNGNYQANSGLVKFTDTTAGVASYSKTVYASFPNVPPGTSRIVSQTFPMLSYCNRTHTLTALVDSAGTVPERNESDNSMQVLYHPDL